MGSRERRFTKSAIRFGVISVNDLTEWAWESFEADYGPPHCPKCGNKVEDIQEMPEGEDVDNYEVYWHSCRDYFCAGCRLILGSDYVYGDEPLGHVLDDGEYKAFIDEQNDVMICQSPYFTYAQYCSPCAPGAGHLGHPLPANSGAPKVYCFGHDWFEDDQAPYPVYSVATGERVEPTARA